MLGSEIFFVNPEDSPWTFLELLDNIGNVL